MPEINVHFILFIEVIAEPFRSSENQKLASTALSNYIKTASLIRSSNGYERSIAANLEKIIAGDFELCKNLAGMSANSQNDFTKAFVAIAAPSFEGKTQFAFVLKEARPLYFSLGAKSDIGQRYKSQSIYLNFKDLNRCIEESAKYDISKIINSKTLESSKKKIRTFNGKSNSKTLRRITADQLNERFGNTKFFTLGLLYRLVEDARTNYDTLDAESRPAWMEYHAHRTNFKFSQKSINEVPVDFFKGYCLFLDEFRGKKWAIYIRNLARIIGLRCCVSNTNAKVANLVGKNHSHMSGVEREYVWSIVITELKSSNHQILNSLTDIDNDINWIHDNAISDDFIDDKAHFKAFFEDFKNNQIGNLRPGVSLKIAEFIKSFCQSRDANSAKITFESFFNDLVEKLSQNLANRKPYVRTTVQGRAANLSLLLSPSYNRTKANYNLNSSINYLQDHFYYLINPANASNWLFITCPSEESNTSCPLVFFKENVKYNWETELTYFKSEELLTILACMNLYNGKEFESFSFVLNQIYQASKLLSFDTGATENPLAVNRDGNRLEVLSTLCTSNSSHHDPLEKRNSLKGQCGSKFFMNLLVDLKISLPKNLIRLDYSQSKLQSFNIQKYLEEDVLIPFLYVSNCELPNVFNEMMMKSNIRNRSINMGTLTRTANKARIDIEFPFYFRLDQNKKFYCKMECKNWKKNVLFVDLVKIFERAQPSNQCPISITICDGIGKPSEKKNTLENITEYCRNNRINAYRFGQTDPLDLSTFSLVPLSDYLSDEPLLVAFVIELKVINGLNRGKPKIVSQPKIIKNELKVKRGRGQTTKKQSKS